jgi:hypothetical protein
MTDVNGFMANELAEFRTALESAGIGLLNH